MYFYKNGKKVKHSDENLELSDIGKKCHVWVFIFMGIISVFITIWLVYCISNDKKR